jgi:ABC-type multidrug transport system fused ATPase/permease subunit
VLKSLSASLSFMSSRERLTWVAITISRSLLAALDVIGLLIIGLISASIASALASSDDLESASTFLGLAIPDIEVDTILWWISGVLALFILKGIFSILLTRKSAFFVAGVEARAALVIAEVSFGGDLSNARNKSREEMMFAIQTGTNAAFNTLLNSTSTLVTEASLFVAICLGFFLVDPIATIAAIAYFASIAVVIQYFVGTRMGKAAEVTTLNSVVASTAISDLLSVFRELIVLDKRGKYIGDIYNAKKAAAQGSAVSYYLSGMPRYIIEAALLLGIVLLVASQSMSGNIIDSIGNLTVFLAGGFRLTASLLPLQGALLTMKAAAPAAAKAHEILNELNPKPTTGEYNKDTNWLVEPEVGALTVRIKGVEFTYPNAKSPAIKDINMEIRSGSQVALIGPSGAGKSTIADLICKVLEPSLGEVIWETSQPQNYGTRSGIVSYVPQSPRLVSGTIVDNVALGVAPEALSLESIEESLKKAHLWDFVATLPNGVNTHLGKLQDGLSGGQIQRLGLARALYSDPGLLVMDEATSALDGESELEIQTALENMRGRVTVVLIAHRLNTIQKADTVFYIKEGSLLDFGKFKDLIKRNPAIERNVDLLKIDQSE